MQRRFIAMQRRLTHEAMKALIASKRQGRLSRTHLIDVRGQDEVQVTGLIPLAINIPLDQLECALKNDQESFLNKYEAPKPLHSETLVMYCKMGSRAEQAAAIATQCGYHNTEVYLGGWDEWSNLSTKGKGV
ncbi:Heat shock protein 67Bb [Trypanosoma grayi]|uniref:Heat shock protein 67Bb n=1 Tax=Trypanosoma grayi TaxID=71804 RepID=UPI0004F43559|nr:Heat shock protein 67Bb [Trypanosoma grayi]KEG12003.1 Heat shock protein 67Bb [Trypanosoma grayi]